MAAGPNPHWISCLSTSLVGPSLWKLQNQEKRATLSVFLRKSWTWGRHAVVVCIKMQDCVLMFTDNAIIFLSSLSDYAIVSQALKDIIRTQEIMKSKMLYTIYLRDKLYRKEFICIVARDWHNLLVREESSFSAVILGVIHMDTGYVAHIFTWSVLFSVSKFAFPAQWLWVTYASWNAPVINSAFSLVPLSSFPARKKSKLEVKSPTFEYLHTSVCMCTECLSCHCHQWDIANVTSRPWRFLQLTLNQVSVSCQLLGAVHSIGKELNSAALSPIEKT